MSGTMATCVLKRLLQRIPKIQRLSTVYIGKRTILSEAHCCQDVWDERRKSHILKKVNVGDFALRIQERLDKGGVQAIDMDILANKLDELEVQQWGFVQNLFYRFRHTNETITTPESTSHAVIRALVMHGEKDRLFEILSDKINYGLFLDDYSALYLIDHFIKSNQYHEAAQIAYDMMLQEDFGHPLVRALSLLACIKHWKSIDASAEPEVETTAEDEEDQWIPIRFIRNPWYDDHWDIKRDSLKLGKTFTMIAALEDNALGLNFTLIGRGLHEKFPEAIRFMSDIAENTDQRALAKEATDAFMDILENVQTKEHPEEQKDPGSLTMEDVEPYITAQQKEEYIQQAKECVARLESQNQIVDENLEETVLEKVKRLATLLEQKDIDMQKSLFKSWEEDRQALVDAQLEAIRNRERREEIAKKLIELQQKEERLSYFEEQQKIHLGISRAPKIRPIEDVVEEEQFVLPPTERGRSF